jgi:hypothetical protein
VANPNHDHLGRFSSGAVALGKIAAEPGATFTEAEFEHAYRQTASTGFKNKHFAALSAMQASGHVAKVEAYGQHVHQGNSGLYVRSLKPLPTAAERVAANNAAMKNAKAVAMIKKQGHTGQAPIGSIPGSTARLRDRAQADRAFRKDQAGHMPSTVEEAKVRIKALKSQIRKVQGETKALSDARIARLERKEGMPMGSKKEWKAKQWAKLKAAGAYLDMTKK